MGHFPTSQVLETLPGNVGSRLHPRQCNAVHWCEGSAVHWRALALGFTGMHCCALELIHCCALECIGVNGSAGEVTRVHTVTQVREEVTFCPERLKKALNLICLFSN